MIVDFNTLPNDSRLWIYQSNREFTPIELEEIEILTKKFLNNWQAHNKELEVSYQIKYNRFLILAVNESFNSPGGCSIDSSISFVKDLSEKINIVLSLSGFLYPISYLVLVNLTSTFFLQIFGLIHFLKIIPEFLRVHFF